MSLAAPVGDSMLGKRDIIVESDRGTHIRIKADWLLVEEAAFKSLDHFPAGATRAVHWSDMGFDDFIDAGFITLKWQQEALRSMVKAFETQGRFQVSQTKRRFDAVLDHDGRAYTSILFDTDGSTDSDVLCVLNNDNSKEDGHVTYIHTTYMSAAKVAEALKERGEELLVIYDEAHHYNHSQLGALTSLTPDIIFVSGTWRGIPVSLISSDEDRQYIMTITEAIAAGIIVPQRFILPHNVDVNTAGIETQAEFIATVTMRLGYGPRRLLLFSPTVADAKKIMGLLERELASYDMHMEARVITGATPAAERDATIRWMSEGDRKHVRVISSVHVFDEGIDIPAVDCVFINTVGDHNLYIQRAFRSVRLYPGKTIATVMVWSTPETMVDVCQDRPGWEQTLQVMTPCLNKTDRAAEKAATETAISVIQRGIVGFSQWRDTLSDERVEALNGAGFRWEGKFGADE
ncbi:hypothetical protein JKP88DRAFT_277322 [Tribonema minus]|uniref:Helicase C-terminal domain-containing protein n=1 Tax=Tribonema minus TaxID=303371 RepID=A0A836CFY2_9STRA|nr:hypothetical protein JKP88DRAFT_277322 [Tribonema minus]